MKDIGVIRKNKHSQAQVWQACQDCGKERWVRLIYGKPAYQRCGSCAHVSLTPEAILKGAIKHKGMHYSTRQGGRLKLANGYIRLRIHPGNFFYPMADLNGYILEHRLVFAKHLGRCLVGWEIVHHKDGIRDHNDLGNLEITTQVGHALATKHSIKEAYDKGFQEGLRVRDDELMRGIRLLQWQIKELQGKLQGRLV